MGNGRLFYCNNKVVKAANIEIFLHKRNCEMFNVLLVSRFDFLLELARGKMLSNMLKV